MYGCETEAAAVGLGRVKGLEHPVDDLWSHAAALVFDFKKRIRALLEFVRPWPALEIDRVRLDDSGGQRDRAAFLVHRIRGIGDQVHQHLADLGGLRLHDHRDVRELVAQMDAFADARGQQVRHFADQGVQVDVGDVE